MMEKLFGKTKEFEPDKDIKILPLLNQQEVENISKRLVRIHSKIMEHATYSKAMEGYEEDELIKLCGRINELIVDLQNLEEIKYRPDTSTG